VHAIAVPLHGGIDAGAILREVGQRIAAYMVPRAIEVVDALPVTPNGKVDYPALKQSRLVDA
jgi:acyl-coenzyme A synthetase/AMP-(fatty) acid ligase